MDDAIGQGVGMYTINDAVLDSRKFLVASYSVIKRLNHQDKREVYCSCVPSPYDLWVSPFLESV